MNNGIENQVNLIVATYQSNNPEYFKEVIIKALTENILNSDKLKEIRSLDWECFYKTFEILLELDPKLDRETLQRLIETCFDDCICLYQLKSFVQKIEDNGQQSVLNAFLDASITLTNSIFNRFNEICKDIENHENTLAVVKDLVKNRIDVRNKLGSTLLHRAVHYGRIDFIQWLLEQNQKLVNAVIISNRITALHIAASNGDLRIFKLLLNNTPELINKVDIKGCNVLHYAAAKGHLDIVTFLLSRNPELLNNVDINGCNPLHLAALKGHLNVVRFLLLEVADLNALNKKGKTILHLAAAKGHLDVVKLILEANPELVNKVGGEYKITPLHLAAYNGRLDVVIELLEHGANFSQFDEVGHNALHYALNNERLHVVEYFFKKNLEPLNALDKEGKTILHHAACYGKDKVVKLLVTYGANINIVDKEGKTPLHYTAERYIGEQSKKVAELLISAAGNDKLAYINRGDQSQKTALDIAKENNRNDIVELVELLEEAAKQSTNVENASASAANQQHNSGRLSKFTKRMRKPDIEQSTKVEGVSVTEVNQERQLE